MVAQLLPGKGGQQGQHKGHCAPGVHLSGSAQDCFAATPVAGKSVSTPSAHTHVVRHLGLRVLEAVAAGVVAERPGVHQQALLVGQLDHADAAVHAAVVDVECGVAGALAGRSPS